MDTVWLLDFEALVAQRNFSRAAEDRHVSQPAFSRRIRALEEEVGARLIDRQTLPLSLTPAGEVFLVQARTMLKTWQETLDRCQTVEAEGKNVLRFATTQSLYLTHYRTTIAPLAEGCGLDIDLNSTGWSAEQFVTALQQRYCDVILTYWHPSMDYLAPLDGPDFEHVTLAEDDFLPVSVADAAGRPRYALLADATKPIPLLSYGTASALRAVQDGILNRHVKGPRTLVVNQNAQALSVKAMIAEGFGMGWLPRGMCARELADRRFAEAGAGPFHARLEMRLYRAIANGKPSLSRFWAQLKADTARKAV